MKKTRAFIVKSGDLFKSGSWTVAAATENPNIEKRCPVCNSVLFVATLYTDGKEETSLYCPTCKEVERCSC